MRANHLFLLLGLACSPLLAQNNSQNLPKSASLNPEVLSNPEQLGGRTNQRTERIHLEDAGSRVDEVRIGGQTQSISVQPKSGNLPSYEVQSPDGARGRSGSLNGAETSTAPRVWNVMKF